MKIKRFTEYINERSNFNIDINVSDTWFLIEDWIYMMDLDLSVSVSPYPAEPDVGIMNAGFDIQDWAITNISNVWKAESHDNISTIKTLLTDPENFKSLGLSKIDVYNEIMKLASELDTAPVEDATELNILLEKLKQIDKLGKLDSIDLTGELYDKIETATYDAEPDTDDYGYDHSEYDPDEYK